MNKLTLWVMILLISSCAIPADLSESAGKGKQEIPIPGAVTARIISLNSVAVSWNPVQGAASYSVFRSVTGADGTFTRIKVTTETSYIDTNLTIGTIYYYQVSVALNNMGESERSTTVFVCPMLPSMPVNVRTEVISGNSIVISWDAAMSADSYRVYRADTANGTYNILSTATVSGLSYNDTSVTVGGEYYYKVSGTNNLGEGEKSSYTFGATILPSVPEGLTGTSQSQSQISISWNTVFGASAYKLYRADTISGPFTLLTTLTIPDLSYTDTSLNPVTEYFYRVSAVNGIGESTQSAVVSAITQIPPPDTIIASPDSAVSIAINWSNVVGAINYKLYRSIDGNGHYELITTTPSLSYSDVITDTTKIYFYKVSALNVNGESVLSVHTKAGFSVPNAPSGLTAVPASPTSIRISWDIVPGASEYKLYHSNTTATGTYNLITTVTATSYTHGGLTINTSYYYKVSAKNIIGEGEQTAYITGNIAPPATPANLRVEPVSHNSLRISWDPVLGASLYSIYRSTGSSVPVSNIITSTTDTYYIDTGLNPFRQYYYKVSATNDIGTSTLTTTAVSGYTQPIPLEEGVWYSRKIYTDYSNYCYYSFPVSSGNYYIQWGNVGHTAESNEYYTKTSAYWNSTNTITGLSTIYFTEQTGGLANPRKVQAPNLGYIIIRVQAISSSSSVHDIRFYKE
jgi:fibronectin type 3 domain-containing protein